MSAFEDSADTRVICSYLEGIVVVVGHTNKMTVERLVRRARKLRHDADQHPSASSPIAAAKSAGMANAGTGGANRSLAKPAFPTGGSKAVRRVVRSSWLSALPAPAVGTSCAQSFRISLRQTRKPDEVVVCLASPEDIDPELHARSRFPGTGAGFRTGTLPPAQPDSRQYPGCGKSSSSWMTISDDAELIWRRRNGCSSSIPTSSCAPARYLPTGSPAPGHFRPRGLRLVEIKSRRRSEPVARFQPVYSALWLQHGDPHHHHQSRQSALRRKPALLWLARGCSISAGSSPATVRW